MFTVFNVMLVTLGVLLAALVVMFLMPAYRRRIERFTHEQIKRSLPLTENEIRADKDRLRAEFALEVHKLERLLEEAAVQSARQSVEVNRRDAKIVELETILQTQQTNAEEHQNARRVLEQTILDRIPKIEARLSEARRMLLQRDNEIAKLTESSVRQSDALEQATQINVQLTSEVERLRSALETRAARNREAIGDPRFDGEVALRSEIEALRARSRDQAQIIERLQTEIGASEAAATSDMAPEITKLRDSLARAEAELLAAKAADGGASLRVRELEEAARSQEMEISRLRASLHAYEEGAKAAMAEAGEALTAKAEIHALRAEAQDQATTIAALKAEIASANEQLARQAQHFRDEMRRLSLQDTGEEEGRPAAHGSDVIRRSLAERIAQPRLPRAAEGGYDASSLGDVRAFHHLKAVNGGAEATSPEAAPVSTADESGAAPARRSRLLERISNLDKSSG